MMTPQLARRSQHRHLLSHPVRLQAGAALVELTVVLALFMVPLLLGLVEAGRLIYTYKILVHQAHHTARYLSVQAPGQNHATALCLFKTGYAQSTCLASDALLPGFNDASFVLTIDDASNNAVKKSIANAASSPNSHLNVTTVTATAYPYTFVFSDLFGGPSLSFGPVSASFRQVH
ncbi:hypothetical protein B9Z48_14330 [Limnohabitans sp. WS1]|nr:hypothetical protein B9Z48_14330 [Limnohabitans sp. WS1]